jgi:Zn-dependent protease
MSSRFELGTLFGLRLTADVSAFIGFAVVWGLTFIVALAWLGVPPVGALAGGLVCAVLHFGLELIHQLGHAAAARTTGYPMRGAHFWLALARSVYSRDEGDLPGHIHVRRALGGPILSGLLCVPLGLLAVAFQPFNGTPGWIAAFAFLDNLLVFTLGALLPLGFTDGSTLLRWWGKGE